MIERSVGHRRAPEVAVIGGGLTGLVAARRLARAGARVALLERNTELGGLAASFALQGGQRVERVHHFIFPTDDHLLALAREVGLQSEVQFHRSSIAARCDGAWWPLTTPLDLLRFAPLSLPDRLRSGLTAAYLQRMRAWRPLSQVSALDWLRRRSGKAATELLWEPLLRGKFDRHAGDISMAWLWHRIKLRQDSQSLFEGERLGYLGGGLIRLVEAVARDLEEDGAEIAPAASVEHVGWDGAANRSYVTVNGTRRHFDAVGATVSNAAMARLLDGEPLPTSYVNELQRVPYMTVVEMAFTTSQPISGFFWHQFQEPAPPFLTLISLSNLVGTSAFQGRHMHYVGSYFPSDDPRLGVDDDTWRQRWLAALENLFPGFSRDHVLESHVFRMTDSQHVPGLGHEEHVVPLRTPIAGVYLSNFAQIYPEDRGLNLAVREGQRLAEAMLEDLERTAASRGVRTTRSRSLARGADLDAHREEEHASARAMRRGERCGDGDCSGAGW